MSAATFDSPAFAAMIARRIARSPRGCPDTLHPELHPPVADAAARTGTHTPQAADGLTVVGSSSLPGSMRQTSAAALRPPTPTAVPAAIDALADAGDAPGFRGLRALLVEHQADASPHRFSTPAL